MFQQPIAETWKCCKERAWRETDISVPGVPLPQRGVSHLNATFSLVTFILSCVVLWADTTCSQTILHTYAVYMLLSMPTSPFRPPLVCLEVRLQYWKLALEEQGWTVLQGKSMKWNCHFSSRCVSVVSKACHTARCVKEISNLSCFQLGICNFKLQIYPAENRRNNVMLKCAIFESVTINFEIRPNICHDTHH